MFTKRIPKGHFTKSGHFIILRGVQDGQILVANPASYSRRQKLWDLSIILSEASKRAGAAARSGLYDYEKILVNLLVFSF